MPQRSKLFTAEQDMILMQGNRSCAEVAAEWGQTLDRVKIRRASLRRRWRIEAGELVPKPRQGFPSWRKTAKEAAAFSGAARFARPDWFDEPDPQIMAAPRSGGGGPVAAARGGVPTMAEWP